MLLIELESEVQDKIINEDKEEGELLEPYFVNYAVRGCQCHGNRTDQSYVSGSPLSYNNQVYFNGYPRLYAGMSEQPIPYNKSMNHAMYVEPSSNFQYVFKGFTGGS